MTHDPVFTLSFALPIILTSLGIFVAVLAITLSYLKRKHMFTLYHQERMAALEKGVDLPPLPDALLTDEAKAHNPRRLLLRGLVWLFVGLGIMVAVYSSDGIKRALFGLIPAGIGLAHLIYYVVAGKGEADLYEQERLAALRKP